MGILDNLFKKRDQPQAPFFMKEDTAAYQKLELLEQLRSDGVDDPSSKEKLERDIKTLASGINGENSVAYELKNSYLPIIALRDLQLARGDLSAQIDFVVVAADFLLVVECKALLHDVEINERGDFLRCFKSPKGIPYKKEGIYNPVAQNRRHVEMIRAILSEDTRLLDGRPDFLHSAVVLANPKTVVRDSQAPQEVRACIVRCDQLVGLMEGMLGKQKRPMNRREMEQTAQTLLQYQQAERIDRVRLARKYGLLPPEPQIPQCPKCGVPMVLRTARRGDRAGSQFYGCPNYPHCRQTRPAVDE